MKASTTSAQLSGTRVCYDGFLKPRDAVNLNRNTFKLCLCTPDKDEGFIFLAPWEWGKAARIYRERANQRTLLEHCRNISSRLGSSTTLSSSFIGSAEKVFVPTAVFTPETGTSRGMGARYTVYSP